MNKMKKSDQDECVLCCREITIYAAGVCDHPVCHECSTRMRVLCETNECPICRSNMPNVIFTLKKEPFAATSQKYSLVDKKYQIIFQNKHIQQEFLLLLENKCKECEELFPTFNKLRDHVRREHNLQYCELCAENLKIFPFERKIYNRKDLARHKRVGDPDETSHRGHPLCEFCEQRYVDSDELFRHLRREHFFCHFCDADGRHQYYEDYEYLRVHFRKEHYLCEEGECVNEKFIGAFRSEIDLKAHIAVHHSKNKSKAEARQARTLELEFSYTTNRQNGNASPRGHRFNQHKRQNIEDNTSRLERENKAKQLAEAEKINTQSTLDFPYLSEDGESSSAPGKNLNSLTLQSFNRNSVPQRPKAMMSSEDFPALASTAQGPTVNYSTSVSVTSGPTNSQSTKFNLSIHRQNTVPARTPNVSIHLSQKCSEPKNLEVNSRGKVPDTKQQASKWSSKKPTTFEDEFPKLESKNLPTVSKPVSFTNVTNTIAVNNPPNKPSPVVEVVSNSQGNMGEQFVIIKGKSRKKKHNKAVCMDSKTEDEDDEKDELSNQYSLLLNNNNFNLLDEENEKFKKNRVRPTNSRAHFTVEDTWQQKVSFGKDDFPPLAPSDAARKPPGFNGPKKKSPPPGFSANSNSCTTSTPLNISLSSIARQIVVPDKNKTFGTTIPFSELEYIKPNDFKNRNDDLALKIKQLNVFDSFRTYSSEFMQSKITAETFYSKCLEILEEKDFYNIFPELICLLPHINKQQELLNAHRKYQNNGGAVPKEKSLIDNISVCDICYQVLQEKDFQSHVLQH